MVLAYFLPPIILLGIITTYEDIKSGKIRNKWVVFSLIYSFIVYFILIMLNHLNGTLNYHFLIELITNFLFVVLLGFVLWYIGIWTAGDGKLFIAFSVLMPISVYEIGYVEWVPSLVLLMNVFIVSMLIMAVFLIFNLKINNLINSSKSILKEMFEFKKLVLSIVYLFSISWIVQIITNLLMLTNTFLQIFLTIITYHFIQKKFKNKGVQFMITISLGRLFLDNSIFSINFVYSFIFIVLLWKLVRSFLRGVFSKIISDSFSKEIRIKNLNQGMVLAESIQKKGSKYIKKPKQILKLDNFIDMESEGLTFQQLKKVKKTDIKTIKVSKTIPFAPFIFLGVILTLLFKGNILIFIKNLF